MFLKNRYLFSGLLVIFLMMAVFLIWKMTLDGLLMLMLVLLFLRISYFDLKFGIIPDGFIVYGVIIQILVCRMKGEGFDQIFQMLFFGLLFAVMILFIVLMMDSILQSPSMGGGDIKLIFMLGMMTTPFESCMALFLSCIIGLLAFLLSKEKRNTAIPFGPALCGGWLIMCSLTEILGI